MRITGFSALRDIFAGRLGTDNCVRSLIFLRSPSNTKEYLKCIHRITYADEDISKNEIWRAYPNISGVQRVEPIRKKDLTSSRFMNKQANKLSFDMSRFSEFLIGYTKVDDNIKPIMLHYSMIYLFDFFSRTWLKYEDNWGHGMSFRHENIQIEKKGIFQRAIDAFYFLGIPSIFSLDNDSGIINQYNLKEELIFKEIGKMKYSDKPNIPLNYIIDIYKQLRMMRKTAGDLILSNQILVGYVLLFAISSISRYRAGDWFKLLKDIEFRNLNDLLHYDFLYEWTPSILQQTILRRELLRHLSIESE